jgi:hypothetical protein
MSELLGIGLAVARLKRLNREHTEGDGYER